MKANQSAVWLMGLLATVLLSGCASQVREAYGESDGYYAKSSPAGLSILRAMVESNGFKTHSMRSLSPASRQRFNTIVWCPDTFPNHKKQTIDWLTQWLASGDKTLVYIGRDFSPHASYWKEVATRVEGEAASPSKWIVAREHAASATSRLDAKRRVARPVSLTPWCAWEFRAGIFRSVQELEGPWSIGIHTAPSRIQVRSSPMQIRPSRVAEWVRRLESRANAASTAPPARPGIPANANPPNYQETMTELDEQQLEIAKGMGALGGSTWEVLLADERQTSLIARNEVDPISRSKVILVCNNSLFCNYSMLQPAHRQLALNMIAEFSPGNVGFLAGTSDPKLRTDDYDDQQKGFEMLTTWPLNVVTIHAAFIGLALIIAAYPIFGRPGRVKATSSADFGKHIEAVGALMAKSGDKQFARKQIADYFRNVRKDSSSPWSNPGNIESPTNTPFRPTSDSSPIGASPLPSTRTPTAASVQDVGRTDAT
jgi:hypothetical protein